MRKPTEHKIVLSIEELEPIIEKMKENQQRYTTLSDQIRLDLVFDTDWNAHRIDPATGYQFNCYAECIGLGVDIS